MGGNDNLFILIEEDLGDFAAFEIPLSYVAVLLYVIRVDIILLLSGI